LHITNFYFTEPIQKFIHFTAENTFNKLHHSFMAAHHLILSTL